MYETLITCPAYHFLLVQCKTYELADFRCLSNICEVLPRRGSKFAPELTHFFIFRFILYYSAMAYATKTPSLTLCLAKLQIR
jgi:hypothetical protein